MSSKKKYLKDEDLERFDNFIQNSLNKYFYVDAWDKLYSITGSDHHDIISDKSTIPDLVIYNKTFNKNDCFLQSNKKKYNKFPRIQFILRPRKFKNYDQSYTYVEDKKENNKNEDKENKKIDERKEDITKTFEFKGIPKEIEDKFIIKDNNSEKNVLYDELKEFMKSEQDNTNEIKVKLISENENENKQSKKDNNSKDEGKKENNRQKRKHSNQGKISKNKFETSNKIYINQKLNNNISFNNYLNYQQKMYQYIQYQNYLNRLKMNNFYNLNNSKKNKFNPINNTNNTNNNTIINNNSTNTNNEKDDNSINVISYFKNTETNQIDEFEKYINNIEEILKKYKNSRNWKVVDNRSNAVVNIFNSEELYYFLNTIINSNENNNYSICDMEKDFYFNPVDIHDRLKNIFQKE